MLSAVLEILYSISPGSPPIRNQNAGAITPSDRFSAALSIADLATPARSRTAVSRPTIIATAPRPSPKDSRSASATARTCCTRLFCASRIAATITSITPKSGRICAARGPGAGRAAAALTAAGRRAHRQPGRRGRRQRPGPAAGQRRRLRRHAGDRHARPARAAGPAGCRCAGFKSNWLPAQCGQAPAAMKQIAYLARLSWHYLWSRPLAAVLNLLLLTLGLAAITLVLLVAAQLDRAFERDLNGIDLVAGAKGSPLQLILAGVFHIDVPTGNIPLQDVQELAQHPMVAQTIPLSLGDSYQGYRIVGTTPDYVAHYDATLAQGQLWQAPMEAVLGAAAARGMVRPGQTGTPLVGATFEGSHGLGGGGHAHGDHPYTVAGVLAPCGCLLDRLTLPATESVWQVHESATAVDADDLQALQAEREVTVALLRYRTPLAAVTLPRYINAGTALQAAAPAIEVTRLLRLLGVGADVLRAQQA